MINGQENFEMNQHETKKWKYNRLRYQKNHSLEIEWTYLGYKELKNWKDGVKRWETHLIRKQRR